MATFLSFSLWAAGAGVGLGVGVRVRASVGFRAGLLVFWCAVASFWLLAYGRLARGVGVGVRGSR